MGWDLKPIRPTKKAPRWPDDDQYEPGKVKWGRYNISGWVWLKEHLRKWRVPLSEFSSFNDGEIISAKTCRKVADAIEKHLPELPEDEQRWLKPHIEMWRNCGGYRQF